MASTLSKDAVIGAIDEKTLNNLQKAFDAEPRNRLVMNALCTTPANKIALNRRKVVKHNNSYSHHLTEYKATAQKGSGRCWMFAGCNTLRGAAIKAMNLGEDFEISQSYLAFWDKFEKANYFLESILDTLDEPTEGRLINFLVRSPIEDGGQWDMFTNLVNKYGCLPKTAQPESESSGSTGMVTGQVTAKLREYACTLRAEHGKGKSAEALRKMKAPMIEEVYRMLVLHYGEPTKTFNWQYRDKDKKNFVREGEMTPKEFFEKYVKADFEDMVCLIHCPQDSKKMHTLYTVKYLGNVVGGDIVRYVNVPIQTLKDAAAAQIKDGDPVWFGCDCGKNFDGESGIWDEEIFNYDLVYGTTCNLNKAERLDYGHSAMNHAMVFTGVDISDDEKPVKWRVENSWGDERADKGFYSMSDNWFDEHMFEVVVNKKHVPVEVLKVLDQTPVELDPWDPMGSLAR
jgi:bleomycin hydrolase